MRRSGPTPRSRARAAVRSWLFSIAARKAIDSRRTARPRAPVPVPVLEPVTADASAGDGDPAEHAGSELWQAWRGCPTSNVRPWGCGSSPISPIGRSRWRWAPARRRRDATCSRACAACGSISRTRCAERLSAMTPIDPAIAAIERAWPPAVSSTSSRPGAGSPRRLPRAPRLRTSWTSPSSATTPRSAR